ncbi:MAG: CHASE domain-containing protein [Magnetococcales bacterium]|nr:CHASE domain-containing protein [Magnetococcales bacterium]
MKLQNTTHSSQRETWPWILGLSFCITAIIFIWVRNVEQEHVEHQFKYDSSVYVSLIQRAIDRNQEVVDFLGVFIATESELHGVGNIYNEFVKFTRLPLNNHKDIRALEFIPRVMDIQRGDFENDARDIGFSDFRIKERNEQGVMVLAKRREEYFPVYFVEPIKGNEMALGFDLASEPVRRNAIDLARDSGKTVITGRIKLVQETKNNFAFLMFNPLYLGGETPSTIEERRSTLYGFALAVVTAHDLVEEALLGTTLTGIDIHIFDESAPSEERFLYYHPSDIQQKAVDIVPAEQSIISNLHWRKNIDVSGRQWSILFSPTKTYLANHHGMLDLIVLVLGILINSLLAIYLYNQRFYTDDLKKISSNLTASNRALAARAACSHAIIKAKNEYELLNKVCQILVDNGGYIFVWAGIKESDSYKHVRPVAKAGDDDGYLDTAKITWADTKWGRGPTGTAIRENRVVITDNIPEDENFKPWRDEATKRKYASSVAIPITLDSNVFGSINIYAAETYSIKDDEVSLLQGLVDDLSFGLKAIREQEQRKQAETALKNSQTRLQGILDNSPTVIYLKDRDGKYLLINTKYEAIFQVDRDDIIGKTDYDIFPKDIADQFTKNDQEVLLNMQYQQYEEIAPHKDCDHTYISVKFPIVDSNQKILGICGISTDITEKKKLELEIKQYQEELEKKVEERTARLHNTTQKLKGAQNLVHMGNWEMNIKDGTAVWSEEVCHIFDRPSVTELSFAKVLDFMHPDDRGRVKQIVDKSIQHGGECNVEYRFMRPNGEIRHIHSIGHVVEWSDGKPAKMAGALQDITDRKQLELELRKAMELAEVADYAKSNFLANISHEIRTPMNAIVGMNHLLSQTSLTKKQQSFIKNIDSSTKTMMNLINNILDFSELEKGTISIEKLEFSLANVIGKLSQQYNRKCSNKGLKFSLVEPESISYHLVGDLHRLEQILHNLLSNALKFTDKGELTLGVELAEESTDQVTLRFSITDTGIGMNSQEVEQLFQAFYQGDTTSTRKYGGTGVGLVISKKMVEMMGGEIQVSSKLGEGSKFVFTVKFAKANMGSQKFDYQLKNQNLMIKQQNSGKLALIDDNNLSFDSGSQTDDHLEIIDKGKVDVAAEQLEPFFNKAVAMLLNFDSAVDKVVEEIVPMVSSHERLQQLHLIQNALAAYNFEECLSLFREWAKKEEIELRNDNNV